MDPIWIGWNKLGNFIIHLLILLNSALQITAGAFNFY